MGRMFHQATSLALCVLLLFMACDKACFPFDPCPHSFQSQAVLTFDFDSTTQRCTQTSLYIYPHKYDQALIEADSLDIDIALATLKEIEIYCPQIHMDSMYVLESLYAYDTQEITHCQQYSIYISHPLLHTTSFSTSFIFSVP